MKTVTSADGTRIAYDLVGDGPPLIVVGGAFSHRRFQGFVKLAELLATRFTVVNYDRRGRGDSGDSRPYAVAREVEDLDALIRAVGEPAAPGAAPSARVFGMSSGAALAAEAATRIDGIRSLALFEPPYMVGDAGHRPPPDHREQLERELAGGRPGAGVRFFLRRVMGVPAFVVWMLRVMPFWKQLAATEHTLPYDAAIMGDFALPAARLASIRTPTLVIAGEKSPTVLVSAARAVADAIPGSRHRVLERQSHNVSMPALAPVLAEHFAG